MKSGRMIAGSTGVALAVAAAAVLAVAIPGDAVGQTFASDTSLSGLLDVYLPPLEDRINPSLTSEIDLVNGAAEAVVRERRQRQVAGSELIPEGNDFQVDASTLGLFQVTQTITPLLLPDMGEMRFAGVRPMVGEAVGGWAMPRLRSH
jgi:hypothetical protein